ncbi:MAG: LysR family transcriptional regulator, partial [Bradyrhizobium sp.]
EGFDAAVRAWIEHRPPAGRLTRPIEVFRDALDRELQALIRA